MGESEGSFHLPALPIESKLLRHQPNGTTLQSAHSRGRENEYKLSKAHCMGSVQAEEGTEVPQHGG